ncbi:hypothetical protein ACIQXF_19440 [Lysinibacillus sp. NPDC097231]|uniref:hypothetical protein n=1 Tax=Lysinibacillus sp. NPDC097231 TaxID=3364142 RepID=UPI00381A2CE5
MEHENHSQEQNQPEKISSCVGAIKCQQLANIIGEEVITSTPVCLVQAPSRY